MMRIAYVCLDPGIEVFGTKGASVHIQEVVRILRDAGHDVIIHTVRAGSRPPEDLKGLEIIETPIRLSGSAREDDQRTASTRIARAIVEWQPDLVWERYSLFSTVLADVVACTGCLAVLEVNAPLIEEQRRHRNLVDVEGAYAVLRVQADAASLIACVSDPVAVWVREHTDSTRVRTVPNGVNTTRIRPRPEAEDVIVSFVGTLKPWHGVDVLLRAAARRQGEWSLRIIGDGPEREPLEALAADLGVDVDFRGAVAPQEVPDHLAGTAIAAAPYPRPDETGHYFSPLKVFEYLAAGLPVVASSVGQIPDLLDGVGVLVEPSDVRALAEAIDSLAADPDRRTRLGRLARKRAEQHDWRRVVDRVLEVVEASR